MIRGAFRTTVPLGVLAFWAGVWIAARRYPSEYDWRYMTVSSLLYPERNPDGYRWGWAGIVLCALAGAHWWAMLASGEEERNLSRRVALWALGVGYLCMLCCPLLPARALSLPRAHDLLALLAFVGVCIGTASFAFYVGARSTRLGDRSGDSRLNGAFLAIFPVSPIALAALTQAYVSRTMPSLPWVGLAWRAHGVPVYLSFAFWEWTACAVLSAYMLVLARVHPARDERRIGERA
ncbi:MAG TPA: hypothetical protein VK437_10635 [Steroidobacteraceae bacterium]|nr:hypothetical protein [Steroidobacteraceae bacterium]